MTGSEVFALADDYVERMAALDPVQASSSGVTTYDDRLTDWSPPAAAERADLVRATLGRLAETAEHGDDDRVAAAVLRERLGSLLALHDAGEPLRDLSVFGVPATTVEAFDLMPLADAADCERLRARLAAVPASLASWRSALEEGLARGLPAARRQALAVADQAEAIAGASGGGRLSRLAGGLPGGTPGRDEALAAAVAADAAFGAAATWLRESYAPRAEPADGVGEERYALWSRAWNGSTLDLRETWEWGWEELARIDERMTVVGEGLLPGAAPAEVAAFLDADPATTLHGVDALVAYLEGITAAAVDALDGVWFDIDPRIRRCDVRVAGEGAAAAPYYLPPSEDLSRPGSTWYPTRGQEVFPRWSVTSTWYHEAVPGHHLQIATTVLQREHLSRFQRTFGWTSGHVEGWAIYAERLMDELGFFADPADEMGYLASQALRAARIVVDIGLHVGWPAPAAAGEHAGRPFDAASARAFLVTRALLDEAYAASEVDRYLGVPGQAISYKVGERTWLAARRAARDRLGDAFDLRDWHMHALRLGSMGLAPFAAELASYRR